MAAAAAVVIGGGDDDGSGGGIDCCSCGRGGGDEAGEYCWSDVLDRLELSAESSSLSALNDPLLDDWWTDDRSGRSSCMCLSSSRLEFNDDDVDESDDDDDDGEDDADNGRRCSGAGAPTNICRDADLCTGSARLVAVPVTGIAQTPCTCVSVGGHSTASPFSDRGILITSGKSGIPDPGTAFSGITNPLSLDMLRRRCSIRAFSDDRPISAYAFIVLKYLLYGCSTRLCDRRWSAACCSTGAAVHDGRATVAWHCGGRGCCCCCGGGAGLRGRVPYAADLGDAAGDESADAVE